MSTPSDAIMAKKIAVIGAGSSGIAAVKCCLDENLEPVCFERTADLGGLWYFKEETEEGRSTVMRSTVINTSKEMTAFSDFPMPTKNANFMHHSEILKYFQSYAKHFGVNKHIRFNHEVLAVRRADDFANTGKWNVRVRNRTTDTEETLIFDGVLVCSGHHAEKNIPSFPGMDQFKGKIIHSHDYKDFRGLEDKRVVIVGIGNSGVDLAVELGRVAKQVYLSTRKGAWVLNRISDDGVPFDFLFNRWFWFLLRLFGISYWNRVYAKKLNSRFDHKLYSLQPKHDVFSQHPTISDDLANRIACGSIIVKADVKRFTKTGVEFVDGTFEDNIDAVLLATGYIFGFPFIETSVIDVKKNQVELYKYMYPPNLERPTLAVIACIQPIGAIMNVAEMQSRIATRVIKGEITLPPRERMVKDIEKKKRDLANRYVDSYRHTIQVDYVPFMDELAEINGCKPNLWKLLITDPKLAFKCFFGPTTSYQYRLMGPGKWEGAREAIRTQHQRMEAPLKTRPVAQIKENSFVFVYIASVVLFALLAFLFRFFA